MAKVATEINFVRGDATWPPGDGAKIIAHICNDIGAWGRGFVLALSERWEQPEAAFRAWHSSNDGEQLRLGAVQIVKVEHDIWVANMIGQHGLRRSQSKSPIRYDAVNDCFRRLAASALEMSASVHMPRIGCGLAGGDWSRIEPIVQEQLCDRGVEVTVYDLD